MPLYIRMKKGIIAALSFRVIDGRILSEKTGLD